MTFKYLGLREQLIQERKKTARLTELVTRMKSDTDYIAMMTDIDISDNESEVIQDE